MSPRYCIFRFRRPKSTPGAAAAKQACEEVLAIVATVELRNQLKIPSELFKMVGWLRKAVKNRPFECLGQLGSGGQLVVVRGRTKKEQHLLAAIARVRKESPGIEWQWLDENSPVLDYLRFQACRWPMRLGPERFDSYREVTLGRVVRKLAAPSVGEKAVIIATRSQLEIWRKSAWRKQLTMDVHG
jgi:hypothetical protein